LQPNHRADSQGLTTNRVHSARDLPTALDRLHYLNDNGWTPLPGWALFFVRLGSSLSGSLVDIPRLVCAVSVPTRSHAAVFAAIGVVAQRTLVDVTLDATEHLDRLRKLPPRSSVFVRVDATRRVPCELGGFVTRDGVEYVALEAGGGLHWYIPTAQALRIEPSSRRVWVGPRQTMRTIRANTDFLEKVMGQSRLEAFLRSSRLETLIVGHEGLLRTEMLSPSFAIVDKHGNPTIGKLHDML